MARRKTKNAGNSRGSGSKKKKKGPNSVSDEIRSKLMEEVLGIEPMILSDCDSNRSSDGAIGYFVTASQRIEKRILKGETDFTIPILYVNSEKASRIEEKIRHQNRWRLIRPRGNPRRI